MEHVRSIKVLYIIVNAGFADDVIALAREAGARGATILNARGESGRHELFIGITVDTEKELIICVTDEHTAKRVMAVVKQKAGIETPAHGICFMMPVEQVIGIQLPEPG